MLTYPLSAYRRKRDTSSASCWCSRFGARRSASLLRKRVLLALLHPLLQGCSRDPYRSAKTDHRQSLFCDEFIDLAAAQSQRCCHVWDAQQQRLCWRSLEIFHGFCFFHDGCSSFSPQVHCSRCASCWQDCPFLLWHGLFERRGVQHIAIAGDTEDIQSVWPQLGAYASHMPDERTARVAARGTHAEALLQEVKGKMAFVLSEQAHHECVLGGSAVHDRAINDEQAIGIAVLYDVSIKVRTLREPERIFVDFRCVYCRCIICFLHVIASTHLAQEGVFPGVPDSSTWVRKHADEREHTSYRARECLR